MSTQADLDYLRELLAAMLAMHRASFLPDDVRSGVEDEIVWHLMEGCPAGLVERLAIAPTEEQP